MNGTIEQKRREREAYNFVRLTDPDLYVEVVHIAHLCLPEFVPDRHKAAARVEAAAMQLAKRLLERGA